MTEQSQPEGDPPDGLTLMRRVLDGTLPHPPIASLMGFGMRSVEPGVVVMTCEPGLQHYNPIGSVHGGLAATLLDSVMGCAVHSLLPAGVGYTTLELSVNYVRAMSALTGLVVCTGTVLHLGRRMATAEGRLVAESSGKLLAHGTTTVLVQQDAAG